MVSDKRADQQLPRMPQRARVPAGWQHDEGRPRRPKEVTAGDWKETRQMILHPVSIIVQIINIIVIYSLLGLKSALALTFFLLAIVFFLLLKPDEEA